MTDQEKLERLLRMNDDLQDLASDYGFMETEPDAVAVAKFILNNKEAIQRILNDEQSPTGEVVVGRFKKGVMS